MKEAKREEVIAKIKQEVNASNEFKYLSQLSKMVSSIVNGSAQEEMERQPENNRWLVGLTTDDLFKKLLSLTEVISQNPALSEISLLLAKTLKPMLEITIFPANVDYYFSRF